MQEQYDPFVDVGIQSRHPLDFKDDFEFRAYLEGMCHPHEELIMGPFDPTYPMDTLTVKRRVAGLKRQQLEASRVLMFMGAINKYAIYLGAMEEILDEIRQKLPGEPRKRLDTPPREQKLWALRPEGS